MNLNDAHILNLKIAEVELEGATTLYDNSYLETLLCDAFNSRNHREALNLQLAKENQDLKEQIRVLTDLAEEQYKEIERLKDRD